MEAERAHEFSVAALAALAACRPLCRWLERGGAEAPVRLFGLDFPNRIGLADGFDKNGRAWPAAAALGFGHVEIGTVTARAQPGNPIPRLFRYPRWRAVINRMGFNNAGAAAVAARLARQPSRANRPIPLGINLGKSRAAGIDEAVADYLASFSVLADFADYLVVNVSSPNTPGLRSLQEEERLRELVSAIAGANRARARPVPLLLKLTPDLDDPGLDAAVGVASEAGMAGIIATNTTIARPPGWPFPPEAGGLSGAPLRERATEVIRRAARATAGRLPIIGVGGIFTAADAREKLEAGAALVQIYTAMIYRGPFLARELARVLAS